MMKGKDKGACMSGCKGAGWPILIVGILYVLQDYNVITWWNVSWFAAVFLLIGAHKAFCKCCE